MWPFRNKPADEDLAERLATVEGQLKALRRDLTDLDDSCAQRFGRLFKRVQREPEAQPAAPEPDPMQLPLPSQPNRLQRASQRFGRAI